MNFIYPALCFCFIYYSVYRICCPLLSNYYVTSILSNKAYYDASLPERLSRVILPKRYIFRALALPIPGKDGEEINIGTVIVCRSGVFILCQIHGSGLIENSGENKWKHMQNGKTAEFDNPFRSQQYARSLLEFYAKNHGLDQIKAHTILIYTDKNLKFTERQSRSVIYAGNYVKKLKVMNKLGKLSKNSVNSYCRLLENIDRGAIMI